MAAAPVCWLAAIPGAGMDGWMDGWMDGAAPAGWLAGWMPKEKSKPRRECEHVAFDTAAGEVYDRRNKAKGKKGNGDGMGYVGGIESRQTTGSGGLPRLSPLFSPFRRVPSELIIG